LTDKGRTRVSLVAVDLPISKSRLLLHHPPLFRFAPAPGLSGSFRVAEYVDPDSAALQSNAPSVPVPVQPEAQQSEVTQRLVSQLPVSKRTARPARNLPLRVVFPHLGPSIFLVSELTSENQTPAVEFDFSRDRKRGDR
jgi:hypothetical protein